MPTDNELLDSPVGKIQIDGYVIQFASLRTIYKHRCNESLLIIVKGHDNQNIIYNYKEFSKLQAAQKGLAIIEQQDKAARRAAAETNNQMTLAQEVLLYSRTYSFPKLLPILSGKIPFLHHLTR